MKGYSNDRFKIEIIKKAKTKYMLGKWKSSAQDLLQWGAVHKTENPVVECKNKSIYLDEIIAQFMLENQKIRSLSKLIYDEIYQIEKYYVRNDVLGYDILIEQNNKSKEFKIKLSDELRIRLEYADNLSKKMILYVTAENDPNILYKTIDISILYLIDNIFKIIDFDDYDGTPCNIFTRKIFENYKHLDKRQ